MAERSLRGMSIGAKSLESDDNVDFAARSEVAYICPKGHRTILPFAEGAEVAGGYYVFEADNLDEALALAQDIPAAKYGAVEVWPMVHWQAPEQPLTNDWLALLLDGNRLFQRGFEFIKQAHGVPP